MPNNYKKTVLISCILAICVVALGAYTRLSDAGLGCPDWPGCYGFLTVPKTSADVAMAQEVFPGFTVEKAKAWKEMIHRYFAGVLGILILVIFIMSVTTKRLAPVPVRLPFLLLLLVIGQAALGMLTVTMALQPMIVMGHLLGGFTILSLLSLLYLRITMRPIPGGDAGAKPYYSLCLWGIGVLAIQIALGGWLAANYAAPHCSGLPLCQGYALSDFSLSEVFQLPHSENYEYGVLSADARMSIHLLHRIWAMVTVVILGTILWRIWHASYSSTVKGAVNTVAFVLVCQVLLGLSLVFWQFPLSVALMHNLVAALLLMSLIRLTYYIKARA